MAELSPDCLRTLYQESASMFLLSSHEKTSSPQKSDKLSEFDPTQTAGSLILRSLYDTHPFIAGNSDYASCIESNGINVGLESNRLRSGEHVTSLSTDAEEKEFSKLGQRIQELRECGTRKVSCSMKQKAEVFSDYMLNSSPLHVDKNIMIKKDFYCPACGSPYFQIQKSNIVNSKIRLKTLKRGRSRRRRASRYTAAKFTLDREILQKHRGGGRTFSTNSSPMNNFSHGSAVASVMETRLALKKTHALRRERDGISKHCINYKCSCGHIQSFKGFRRIRDQNKDSKQKGRNIKNKKGSLATSGKQIDRSKIPDDKICQQSRQANHELNCDFVSFNPVPAQSSLSLDKKKKKKKPPKKKSSKSGLHDFLSSLND
jgi:hypothetical protein